MIFGMNTLTFAHVVISLLGIGSGFVVLYGMNFDERRGAGHKAPGVKGYSRVFIQAARAFERSIRAEMSRASSSLSKQMPMNILLVWGVRRDALQNAITRPSKKLVRNPGTGGPRWPCASRSKGSMPRLGWATPPDVLYGQETESVVHNCPRDSIPQPVNAQPARKPATLANTRTCVPREPMAWSMCLFIVASRAARRWPSPATVSQ